MHHAVIAARPSLGLSDGGDATARIYRCEDMNSAAGARFWAGDRTERELRWMISDACETPNGYG